MSVYIHIFVSLPFEIKLKKYEIHRIKRPVISQFKCHQRRDGNEQHHAHLGQFFSDY